MIGKMPRWAWLALGGAVLIAIAKMVANKAAPEGVKGRRQVYARSGDFEKLRKEYGVDARALAAVFKVESGGRGFERGRLMIRFEPRVFKGLSGGKIVLLPGMSAATDKEGFKRRGGQDDEWAALAKASQVGGEEIALQSTSFGLPQIMGFNYAMLGYTSAKELFEAFKTGEEEQKVAVLRFLKRKKLIEAINHQEWAKVERSYNGRSDGVYAKKLASAFKTTSSTATA